MDVAPEQQFAAELEVEMMTDMYNRMSSSCHKKCINTSYHEAELNKGESVCLDRCIAKYLEIHELIGKKLTEVSQNEEESMKKMQQQQQATLKWLITTSLSQNMICYGILKLLFYKSLELKWKIYKEFYL